MKSRVGAVVGIAVLLVAFQSAVGAQNSASLALVDVPELQLAEGVRQAYVAWYVDGNRETTPVYGLLFGDANDARAFVELATGTGSTTFLVHRQIVVGVRGGNACADALAGLLNDAMPR